MPTDDDTRELFQLLRELTSTIATVSSRVDAHIARGDIMDASLRDTMLGILVTIEKNHTERIADIASVKLSVDKLEAALNRTKGAIWVIIPAATAIGWLVERIWKT